MQKILAIAWKDALVRFSSRSELLFFIILPLVFTFILGGAFDPTGGDNRIVVLVVDEDNSDLSQQLVDILATSTSVNPVVLPRDEAESQFADEGALALLTIQAGFATTLQEGQPATLDLQTIPNNTNTLVIEQAIVTAAGQVDRALTVARQSLVEAEKIRPFSSPEARQVYFNEALTQAQTLLQDAPQRVSVSQSALVEEDEYDNTAHQSAGQLITWVFIPLLGTSGLFAYERSQGTLRRLLTTPTSKATYLSGVIMGQLGTAIIQMVLLVAFGVWVMGLNWGNSPIALAMILFSFGLASVALGTTLGTFVKSEGQASGLSIMFGMVMAMLGGCWYPLEIFPEGVRTAVHVLPTTWAMQGMTNLVMRGQGTEGVMLETAVLFGFALVFFVIGVWRFKYE